MSKIATNNKKNAKTALNPNLSTEMEPASSSDSNQIASKTSKKKEKKQPLLALPHLVLNNLRLH